MSCCPVSDRRLSGGRPCCNPCTPAACMHTRMAEVSRHVCRVSKGWATGAACSVPCCWTRPWGRQQQPRQRPWVLLQLLTHLRQLAVLLQLPCQRLLVADSSVLVKRRGDRVQQLNQHQHLQHSSNKPTNQSGNDCCAASQHLPCRVCMVADLPHTGRRAPAQLSCCCCCLCCCRCWC
jgi:hypothetical protein